MSVGLLAAAAAVEVPLPLAGAEVGSVAAATVLRDAPVDDDDDDGPAPSLAVGFPINFANSNFTSSTDCT